MLTYGHRVKLNDYEELGTWHAACTLPSAPERVNRLGATRILLDAALGVLTLSVPHIGVQSMQDRFTSPRPTFQATSNQNAIEAITPKEKNTTPSLSVVERLEQSGNIYLASLLEEAQKKAKEHATLASARAHERLRTRRESAPVVDDSENEKLPTFNEPDVPVVAANKFQPSDVLDDMTFIRKTRDGNVHTPEMQALFWANGGERHMVGGLSYAQAFDNLRREKMRKLQGEKAASTPYQRHTALIPGAKVMTPGMPSQRDRDRKRNAQVRATRIVANEVWAGIKK